MERTIARPDIRELPHFLFSAPEDDAWVVEKTDEKGTTVFTARRGAAIYRITLLENSLLNGSLRQASAKYVANYYRNGEKNDMIERGVKRGLYELSNVTMGQETIDDKLYYTMKYSTESQKHFESTRLYVFFPFEYGNDYFLVVHYSEAAPSRELLTFSFESELLRILRTVAHKPARSGEQDRIAHRQAPQGSLMEFFPGAYSVTQLPLPQSALEIRCQKHINKGWKAYVSFIGMKKGPIFLVVFTGKKFKAPGKNLFTLSPRKGIPAGGTRNWGYVFDRNHDGKVDYLAFLDGPSPVAPDEQNGDLPNLTKQFTGKELKEIIIPNTKLVFWHMADDNYDGYHDGVAVSMRKLESGWIDGWIVARDVDFDGRYDSCKFFQGKLHSEHGDCEEDPVGYHVTNRKPSGLLKIPPPRESFLSMINAAAEKCQLSGDSFHKNGR